MAGRLKRGKNCGQAYEIEPTPMARQRERRRRATSVAMPRPRPASSPALDAPPTGLTEQPPLLSALEVFVSTAPLPVVVPVVPPVPWAVGCCAPVVPPVELVVPVPFGGVPLLPEGALPLRPPAPSAGVTDEYGATHDRENVGGATSEATPEADTPLPEPATGLPSLPGRAIVAPPAPAIPPVPGLVMTVLLSWQIQSEGQSASLLQVTATG